MVDAAADLDALLALATTIALEAGGLLAERLRTASELVETKSTITDMVTQVDRDSEALLVGRILAERPGDAILGEEGGERTGTSGVRWVLDPLDGTTNYLYGYPVFAVSVAVEVDGEPCIGVVHDAARGETFAAAHGRGALVGGRPASVSDKTDLATALVGTGFSYARDDRARQAQTLTRVLPQVRDVRRAGAAALDLCWVGCGRLDGFYERGLQPWDLAAGSVIVREAGGRTTRLRDGTIVAAGPGLFDPLVSLVGEP
jgi:fructose-1,6-bisphosphatase/inositol monophosphatase family enzyme